MLLRGLRLRCPRCGQGHSMKTFFELRETCPVCEVRFERQPGEGTGAMIILLSTLPLIIILLFFLIYFIGVTIPLIPLTLGLSVLLIVLLLVLYRHARSLWLGVIAATSGLYTDAEYAQRKSRSLR